MVLKGKSTGKLSKEIQEVEEHTEEVREDVEYAIATAAGYTIEGFETGFGKLSKYLSVASQGRFGGSVSFGGSINVAGISNFSSTIKSSGILSIAKETIIKSSLSIGNNLAVGGRIDALGGMNVNNLAIDGNLVVKGNLLVVGNTTFADIQSETVNIQDNLIQLNANLSSSIGSQFNTNDIGWFGQTTINTTETFIGTVWHHSSKSIKFFRQTELPRGSNISDSHENIGLIISNATISEHLSVSGNSEISDSLTILGNLTVKGNLVSKDKIDIDGEINLKSTLSVASTSTFIDLINANGGLAVDTNKFTVADTSGNISTAGTLNVAQTTTISGLLNADAGIAVDTNKFTVADTTGNVATAGTLAATKSTILSSSLSVGNDTRIKTSLSVGTTSTLVGATTISGALNANGGITVDSDKFTVADTTGNVATAGSLSVATTTNVIGATTLSSSLSIGNDTRIKASLSVGGSKNVIGNTHLGEWHTFGSNYAGFGHSSITQANGNYALFQSNTGNTYLNAANDRIIYFRINNSTKALLNSSLLSIGVATRIAQTLSVGGVLNANGGITVDSDKFTVADTTGNVATAGSLSVATTTNIIGATTLSSSLSIGNDTRIKLTLSVGKETILSSTLDVVGNTKISDQLTVSANIVSFGNVIVHEKLSVGKETILSSTLNVLGNTKISDQLTVAANIVSSGNVIVSEKLSIGKETILSSSLSVMGETVLKSTLSVSNTITLGSGSTRYTLPNAISGNPGYALKVPESGNTLEWGEVVSFFTVRDSVDLNPNFTDVRIIEFDSSTGFELARATDTDNNVIANSVKVSIGSHWKDLIVGSDTLTPTGQESLEFKTGTGISITASSSDTPQSLTIATNGTGTSLLLSQTLSVGGNITLKGALSVGGNYLYFNNYSGNDVGIRAHDGTPQFKSASGNWVDISSTVEGASGTINTGAYGKLSFYSAVGTGKELSSTDNIFWDDTNDRLGIKVSSPTSTLDVDGDATFSGTVTAQEVSSISDKKFKTNINTIKNPIEKILKIRGVSFDWKHNEYPELSNRKQIGFIAQELEEVVPEVVLTNGHKTVCYDKIVALLIEGIKEQQIRINSLEDKLLSIDYNLSEKLHDISSTFSDHETAITLVNNNLCGLIEDNLKENNNMCNINYRTYSKNVNTINKTIYSV